MKRTATPATNITPGGHDGISVLGIGSSLVDCSGDPLDSDGVRHLMMNELPTVESGYWDAMIGAGKSSVKKGTDLDDDLMQEGRLRAYQALQNCPDAEEYQAKVIVYRASRFAAINFMRVWDRNSNNKRNITILPLEEDFAEGFVDEDADVEEIVLGRMEENPYAEYIIERAKTNRHYEALYYKLLLGLNRHESAEAMGIKISAVSAYASRGMRDLQRRIAAGEVGKYVN